MSIIKAHAIKKYILSLDSIKNNNYIILARAFKNQMNTFLNPHIDVNVYAQDLNVIYISIPKTGNSSIRSLLFKKAGENYDENDYKSIHSNTHLVFEYIKKQQILKNKNSYKFAFVRNPFDRLVSCYKNKILDEDYAPIQRGYVDMFYKGMPFYEFAKNVCEIPDLFANKHFRSQYSYLYYKNNLIVDYLGRFENMSGDFQAIKEKLLLEDLPHFNKSTEKSNYRDYYTPYLVDLVYNRYKNDVTLFGYMDELKQLKKYVSDKELMVSS